MNILVIGAGDVGQHITRTLSGEEHDVTVLDKSQEVVDRLAGRLDASIIRANGASPKTLAGLNVSDYDLVLAVTESDEANVIAGLSAVKLGAGEVIVRVRDKDYFGDDDNFAINDLGISFVVHPEEATAEDIAEAIQTPGAVHIEYFAEGRLAVAEVVISDQSPLIGQAIGSRQVTKPHFIVGYERGGVGALADSDHIVEEGDSVYIIAAREHIAAAAAATAGQVDKVHSAMIFGGGRIGLPLARNLKEAGIRVILLEKDQQAATRAAEQLPGCDVLCEEGVSKEALLAQGVDSVGAFVACAGDDRANLLAAEQAKELGAGLCLAIISREEFVPLVESLDIDGAYAPRLVAAETILRYVRGRDIKAIHLLFSGCQLLELEVEAGSEAIGKTVKEQDGWQVGALIRDGQVIISNGGGEQLAAGDQLLLFGSQQAKREIERFFHKR